LIVVASAKLGAIPTSATARSCSHGALRRAVRSNTVGPPRHNDAATMLLRGVVGNCTASIDSPTSWYPSDLSSARFLLFSRRTLPNRHRRAMVAPSRPCTWLDLFFMEGRAAASPSPLCRNRRTLVRRDGAPPSKSLRRDVPAKSLITHLRPRLRRARPRITALVPEWAAASV
jgi:hypothetical protein